MIRQGSRYALIAPAEEVRALFGFSDEVEFPPRYNIAPPQPIGVVHRLAGGRRFTLMRWGFVPGWVKDPREISLLSTARSETVLARPAFNAAFRYRRCLVPASGFYAWRRGPGRERRASYVRPRAGGVVGLAGLFETWCGAEGSEVDTACLLTVGADQSLAAIGERMPLIIAPADFERWLGPGDSVGDLLRAAPAGSLVAEPVGPEVDSARNDGPDLIRPLAG